MGPRGIEPRTRGLKGIRLGAHSAPTSTFMHPGGHFLFPMHTRTSISCHKTCHGLKAPHPHGERQLGHFLGVWDKSQDDMHPASTDETVAE